jgi:hypothetical protein
MPIFQSAVDKVTQLLNDNKLDDPHSRILFEANLQIVSIYWSQ